MQVGPSECQIYSQCKKRHVVAKIQTNTRWPLEQIHYHGTVDFDTVNTKLPYWDEGNLDSSSLQWINFPFGRLKGRVVPFDCDCDKCKLDQSPTHISTSECLNSQLETSATWSCHQHCPRRSFHSVLWGIFWLWPASSMLTVFSEVCHYTRIRSPFDQRHIVKYANSDPRGSGIKISFQLLDTLDDISNCSPTSLASKQNSILEVNKWFFLKLDTFWPVSCPNIRFWRKRIIA